MAAAAASEDQVHAAFVFIKPHAVTDKVQGLVKESLAGHGITIVSEGRLEAQEIDEKLLIDTHYGAIAKRAVKQQPNELNVPPKAQAAFEEAFGMTWASALEQNLVLNAVGASARLGLDADGLEGLWRTLKKGETLIKFGGGFYCGKLSDAEGEFFVINGFYLQMRSVFTTAPAAIQWFSVTWPAASLSWADFRGKVLGATDPATAPEGAIRRAILDGWQELGLDSEPNTGNNGVHASASPIEGLFERMNWLSADIEADVYGAELVAAGIPAETIKAWSEDPAVPFEGSLQSLFDLHEDMDAPDCTARAVAVLAASKAEA
uniref:Nucleoside-diphosphate kinase n=1 Tax=Rhizochromulina marina TaxID=1034831 RepID=A0A7S2SMY4_9STRA|mmetsp:Transcript_32817/g.94890  ORF Transcript_32817/g.94890 Transcript_32817/m.94890 type:complete len:320 (+) Transcript_32817:56-1015(+)